jgi:glycerol-3-phosphate acyltransferase PlsY
MTENIAIPIFAFLLGALPTAYLAGRLVHGVDIRTVRTGNAGALNTYRQLGKTVGFAVMAVDTGKGALALFVGMVVGADDIALYVSAVLAALGHNFSPFTGMRGGKGGAIVLGISMLMLWHITLVAVGIGAIVYLVRRNSVLALAVIFIALNALTAGTGQEAGLIVTCLALSLIVVGTHGLRTYKNFVPAIKRGDWSSAVDQE